MTFTINIFRGKTTMQDDFFLNTGISPKEIIDQLYFEASIDSNYYLSPAEIPVKRCDVSKDIRSYFEKFLSIPFADCGFLKTYPNTRYPMHKDEFRISALNMTMMEESSEFETTVMNIGKGQFERYFVPYQKDNFIILNVARLHGVLNKSNTLTRTVLSIGFKNHDYFTMVKLFQNKKLFNF